MNPTPREGTTMTEPTLHVCFSRGHYVGMVRGVGCRRWRQVTGRCRTAQSALSMAVRKMDRQDKRAVALFIDDSGYYEPNLAMEAKRT